MVVRDGVVDVLAAPFFGEQSRTVQLLQSLRDGRDLLIEFLGELGDAVLFIE